MTDHPGGLTREHVVWAYRLLLDRDPESDDVIGPKLAGSRDTRELRHHLMTSAEFRDKNRDYAHANDRTVVIKELDGEGSVRLFVDLADHVIGLNIVRGSYECSEVQFVQRVLQPGDTAIDVGAHIGLFTMHMAARVGETGRIHAFEPFAANFALLARSITENSFGNRVQARHAAVGAASGSATLTFPRETLNSGGAYLVPDGGAPLAGNLTARVPIVALDDLAIDRPVRLIKMDVEGAEPQVIGGATRLLARDRPVILSELHPAQLARASGATAASFLALMTSLGYRAHRIENGAPGAPLDRAPAETLVSVAFLPLG
jgi:FkbM family methyltransferase